MIVGARADEEGTRSKERYFSPRGQSGTWDIADQPPEFWDQYKTDLTVTFENLAVVSVFPDRLVTARPT